MNLTNENDTLIIMPHMDDESFLMGGYLTKFFGVPNNSKCTILIICGYGRDENIHKNGAYRLAQLRKNTQNLYNVEVKCLTYRDLTLEAQDIPNIAEQVVSILSKGYKKVFIPAESDLHQDHRIVAQACKIALRNPENYGIREVYECPADYSSLSHSSVHNNTVLELDPISIHDNKIRMSERYSDTENVPNTVYDPYEYYNLIWKML